jgi:multidrug efflux pump subunit AcrB
VARQVRHAYYGAEVLRQQRGRNEIKVKVRLPKEERAFEHNLEEMILRTPTGTEIPLREAVSLKRGRAYTTIDRRNGRRVVTVSADVKPRSQTDQVLASLAAETLPALKQKYPGLAVGFEGRQADRRESMRGLLLGLLMALVVIYAMLAVPFNSFIQPLIIMMSIPFGVVGAVIGHLVMGYSLSVMSTFGIVALSGVVINGALVLIDFANRRRYGRTRGYSRRRHLSFPAGSADHPDNLRRSDAHNFRNIAPGPVPDPHGDLTGFRNFVCGLHHPSAGAGPVSDCRRRASIVQTTRTGPITHG